MIVLLAGKGHLAHLTHAQGGGGVGSSADTASGHERELEQFVVVNVQRFQRSGSLRIREIVSSFGAVIGEEFAFLGGATGVGPPVFEVFAQRLPRLTRCVVERRVGLGVLVATVPHTTASRARLEVDFRTRLPRGETTA